MKTRKTILTIAFTAALILALAVTANAEAVNCDNIVACCYEDENGVTVTEYLHACKFNDETGLYSCQSEETCVYHECSICGNSTANASVSFCDECRTTPTNHNEFSLRAIFEFFINLILGR